MFIPSGITSIFSLVENPRLRRASFMYLLGETKLVTADSKRRISFARSARLSDPTRRWPRSKQHEVWIREHASIFDGS